MIIGNDLSGFCAIIMLIVFEIVTDPKAQKLWGYYAGVGMMFLEVCMILQSSTHIDSLKSGFFLQSRKLPELLICCRIGKAVELLAIVWGIAST